MKKYILTVSTFVVGTVFGVFLITGNLFTKPALALTPGVDSPPPACEDLYNLPGSGTRKSSPWDTTFIIPSSNSNFTSFVDINGDGLADYLYSSGLSNNRSSCTFLNTGSGWNMVFRCLQSQNANTQVWTFKGDCAA